MNKFDFEHFKLKLASDIDSQEDSDSQSQSHNLLLFNYLSDLLSFLINNYEDDDVKDKDDQSQDSKKDTVKIDYSFCVVQLNKFVNFYISCLSSSSNKQSSTVVIIPQFSSNISNLFGKIYILCLAKIQNNNTLIFDTANKMITNLVNLDKKFVNFSNTSSPPVVSNLLSLLIITILQHIFNDFGYNLPSLAPILIQYCYKVLKNIFNSTSTKFITSSSSNSSFQISLLLLVILKNYNGILDDSTLSKIMKIIKPILKLLNISNPIISNSASNATSSRDSKDTKETNDNKSLDTISTFRNSNNCIGVNIPITTIANCFEIFSLLILNSFQLSIKKLKVVAVQSHPTQALKKKNFLNNHLMKDYNHYYIMGLSSNHQQIRISAANGLACLLQHYFHTISESETVPLSPLDSITDLLDILSYYSQLYLLLDDPVVRHSIMISLIQFTSLNEVYYSSNNKNFLLENFNEYLKFFECLLTNNFVILQDAFPKLQQQMLYFFDQFYFKSLGQYNKLIILNKLLGHEAFASSSQSIIKVCSLLKLISCLIINLGPAISLISNGISDNSENDVSSSTILQSTLLKLLASSKFEIRTNSAFAISLYCKYNPSKTQNLLNHCLSEIQAIFRNDSASAALSKMDVSNDNIDFNFAKIHGFATSIAYIIKNINKDYVPEDTIARILTFASSQLKATSTNSSASTIDDTNTNNSTMANSNELKKIRFHKKKISLILLSGIMNYEESFLKIHISQFFIFWKNSLTHNYQSFESGAITSNKNNSSSIDEVIGNLEIRSCALTCLLTFLKNMKITPEISKQATYLLAKSQAYSSSISSLKNEKLNENNWFKIHEKRIMQCHLVLLYHHKQNNRHSFFTNSSNSSSIWIIALNNFSDHQVFNNARMSEYNIALKDKEKDKDKEIRILNSQRFISENPPTNDFNSIDDLALIHDDLCFGLTTKFPKLFISSSETQDCTMMNSNDITSEAKNPHDDSAIDGTVILNSRNVLMKENHLDAAFLTIHQNSKIEISSGIDDWISEMENKILFNPFIQDILNDYLWPIYNGDKLIEKTKRLSSYFDVEQPCSVVTSIIDLGIDIFVNSFQCLSPIIQLSLMEKMRGAIMIKSIDSKNKTTKLREKAIAINCSIAINAILKDIGISNSVYSSSISNQNNNINNGQNNSIFNILGESSDMKFKLLDESVLITMIDSLKHLTLKDRPLLRLNSESIAAISSMLPIVSSTNPSASTSNASSSDIEERVDVYITDIINNMSPFTRAADALIISSMYKKSHSDMLQILTSSSNNAPNTPMMNGANGGGASFRKILDVLLTLVDDPHPVVHYYSMMALLDLLECHISISTQLGAVILQKLYKFAFASDKYSVNCDSTLYSNFHLKFNSNLTVIRIVKVLVMSLGPNLQELKVQDRNILRTLILSFVFSNNANSTYYNISLSILQNLTMFDKNMISLSAYVSILDFFLITNMKSFGIGSMVTSSNNIRFFESVDSSNEIFPYTTSKALFETTIESYFELIKVHRINDVLTTRAKRLLWICVECHNDQASSSQFKLYTLIKYWMLESADIKWFILLNNLYKVYRTSLLADLNSYYHKILTKHDKVQVRVELEDEEVESIVKRADDTGGDANVQSGNTNEISNKTIPIDFANKNDATNVTTKVSDIGNDEEPSSSAFKLFILRLINLLIQSIAQNKTDKQYAKLYLQLQSHIQDIVKIAFSACTSPVNSLISKGVQILSSVIITFFNAEDPYSTDKLLSQQQAQITAALTPAFTHTANLKFDSKLASEAINVLAKFVGYGIVTPLENNGRILNILVNSLEEFSSDSNSNAPTTILIGDDNKYVTARSRNRMKLAILNAWAELKISSADGGGSNPNRVALSNLVEKYLDILVPMWILALREYSSLKYNKTFVNGSDSDDLIMYESIWINCVDVIGCIIEENENLVYKLLEKDDVGNFFFVLFAQCIEMLIKPANITEFNEDEDNFSNDLTGNSSSNRSNASSSNSFRVMVALNKLLSSKISSDIIFQDTVFAETIDLFDRLVIVSDDYSKPVIIDIISRLFLNYFNNFKNHNMVAEKFTNNIDKLFELLRVIVISIIDVIPFVDDNYNSNGIVIKEKVLNEQQLLILKKSFNALVSMIEKFPKIMKVDLFSCILYIISRIYLHDGPTKIVTKNRNMIIPVIIPYLKTIILDLYNEGHIPLVDYFYKLIRPTFKKDDTVSNLTIMILITSSSTKSENEFEHVSIIYEDIKLLISNLSDSLLVKEDLPVAISSIKSLILFSTHVSPPNQISITIIKELIPSICKLLIQDELEDTRLVIEMLVLYSKQYSTESKKLISIFTIVIPIICWLDSKLGSDYNSGKMKQYLHEKLLNLLNLNIESFKIVINEVLTEDQKQRAEQLVKFDLNTFNTSSNASAKSNTSQQHIQLKTFGQSDD